jgi:hypothetical protein
MLPALEPFTVMDAPRVDVAAKNTLTVAEPPLLVIPPISSHSPLALSVFT